MKTEIVKLPITLKELSHELRTPLTGILGLTGFLSEEPLTPEQRSYVDDINKASLKLLELANTLLKAQRISENLLIYENEQKINASFRFNIR